MPKLTSEEEEFYPPPGPGALRMTGVCIIGSTGLPALFGDIITYLADGCYLVQVTEFYSEYIELYQVIIPITDLIAKHPGDPNRVTVSFHETHEGMYRIYAQRFPEFFETHKLRIDADVAAEEAAAEAGAAAEEANLNEGGA